jgi:hypothetical protein
MGKKKQSKDYVGLCTEVYYDLSFLVEKALHSNISNNEISRMIDNSRESLLNIIRQSEDAKFSMRLAKIESSIRRFLRG